MPHFIVRKRHFDDWMYQYPRRALGSSYPGSYMQRTAHGPNIGQARVFTTAGAAKRSSEGWGEVVEVELVIKEPSHD